MKTLSLTILILLNTITAFSCTTFVIKNSKELVFGRNLDWVSDNGVVVVNKRNVQKTALVFPPEKPAQWVSKYGSVTFNQFGKELPFGGINEKGLVVEIMVVQGNYPSFDERKAVNELQWVQYQLDNAETIEEVIASDEKIRISKIDQSIHFLVCDRFGNAAVIEFDKNGMNMYKKDELPYVVLENEPYLQSIKRKEANHSCRFAMASSLVENYYTNENTSAIDYSFHILDKVKLDGSWSIVYDIKNMEIHFKTASYQRVRKIKVDEFNFDCDETSQLYDLKSKGEGFVNDLFLDYSAALNNKKMDAAVESNRIRLPKHILEKFYKIGRFYSCL